MSFVVAIILLFLIAALFGGKRGGTTQKPPQATTPRPTTPPPTTPRSTAPPPITPRSTTPAPTTPRWTPPPPTTPPLATPPSGTRPPVSPWGRSEPSQQPRSTTAYRPSSEPQARSGIRFTDSSSSIGASEVKFRESSPSVGPTKIKFNDSAAASTNAVKAPPELDLKGLHDALTGAALDIARGLFQCTSCKVFYHSDSVELLRSENSGKCVACQGSSLEAVVLGQRPRSGKDHTPIFVTLADYHLHVGEVVTFEGMVPDVRESRRGNDFAVMFENKPWSKGFKLVFFRDATRSVGGKPFISALKGKRVRVRGLIVQHAKYGYQIIVSEKGMILGVE